MSTDFSPEIKKLLDEAEGSNITKVRFNTPSHVTLDPYRPRAWLAGCLRIVRSSAERKVPALDEHPVLEGQVRGLRSQTYRRLSGCQSECRTA